MEYTEKLLHLLQIENNFPQATRNTINERAKTFLNSLAPDAGHFLHRNLDIEKHSERDVCTLIESIPNSLSQHDDSYREMFLPIQRAARLDVKNIPFIPLMAKIGTEHNIGGEGMRGGLLFKDLNSNLLQYLSASCFTLQVHVKNIDFDGVCVEVLERLLKLKLLQKDDIQKFHLLRWADNYSCEKRFDFLVDMDPDALKVREDYHGRTLLHRFATNARTDRFVMKFKAALRHFPSELGLLFEKDADGNTVLNAVSERSHLASCKRSHLVTELHWKSIEKCMDDHQHENGGSAMLEKNMEENTYPFFIAAAGDTSHLDTVYFLLRRNPVVMELAARAKEVFSLPPRKRKYS